MKKSILLTIIVFLIPFFVTSAESDSSNLSDSTKSSKSFKPEIIKPKEVKN